jgi:hypothetical protein
MCCLTALITAGRGLMWPDDGGRWRGTALSLYSVVRRHGEALALGSVGFRLLGVDQARAAGLDPHAARAPLPRLRLADRLQPAPSCRPAARHPEAAQGKTPRTPLR